MAVLLLSLQAWPKKYEIEPSQHIVSFSLIVNFVKEVMVIFGTPLLISRLIRHV